MPKSCVKYNCIGKRIQLARKQNCLTQIELAAAMNVDFDIPMDRSQISMIERCKRSVKDKELFAFAVILNTSPNWFFEWEDNT